MDKYSVLYYDGKGSTALSMREYSDFGVIILNKCNNQFLKVGFYKEFYVLAGDLPRMMLKEEYDEVNFTFCNEYLPYDVIGYLYEHIKDIKIANIQKKVPKSLQGKQNYFYIAESRGEYNLKVVKVTSDLNNYSNVIKIDLDIAPEYYTPWTKSMYFDSYYGDGMSDVMVDFYEKLRQIYSMPSDQDKKVLKKIERHTRIKYDY